MTDDLVRNEEILYRSIRREFATKDSDGVWRFTSEAFRDPERKPSVDRARLQGHRPVASRRGPTDGVARLVTEDVRSINGVIERTEDRQEIPYRIDVIPDPILHDPELPDNPAHAKIVGDRPINNAAFKKLKQILSQLALSVVPPVIEE